MSTSRPRNGARRRSAPADMWEVPPPLPDVEPVVSPPDVGALIRSLGDPPLHHGTAAGHYFGAVVERTAAIAAALALSVDLLAGED